EIVPIPTPAARATSRMVVFAGTASIAIGVLFAFAPRLRFAWRGPSIFATCASLAHISATAANSVTRGPAGASEQEITKSFLRSGFADSDLTDAFCSVKVWNQFQRPPRRSGVSSKTTWGV